MAGLDPSRLRGALVLTLLLSAAVGSAPTPIQAQDARAVKTAEGLLARRTSVAEVARVLASDFRLDPAGVAEVLTAAGVDATRTAAGLTEGLRARPSAVVGALLAAGVADAEVMRAAMRLRMDPAAAARAFREARVPAARTAAALEAAGVKPAGAAEAVARAGYGAAETASVMARRRMAGAEAMAILRRAGHGADEAAPAMATAYRLDGDAGARLLRRAGYPAEEAAAGLVQVMGGSGDVIRSLTRAEYDPRDIRRAAIHTLRYPPEEWVARMKEEGATVLEAAEVLAGDYRLGPVAGGTILVDPPVQYSIQDMASALRLVWELDVFAAYDAASQILPSISGIANVLSGGGYEIVRPTIHAYRIRDPRPGRSGQWLENVGIVDPDAVAPLAPSASDGRVEVLVPFRELDGIEATMAGRVGQIVDRAPHTFQDDGATWEGEWLTIEFQDFDSGQLRLTRAGAASSVDALALGYTLIEGELFEGPIEALTVTLGDPVGEGTVTMEGGTWDDIEVEGSTETFDIPSHHGTGIEADVVDLRSTSVAAEVTPAGEGVLGIDIEIGFEEEGPEVQGSFLEYIPCWTCSDFQVPVSECSGPAILCFLDVLGLAAAALGECAILANWEEKEVAAGPAVPFEADVASASLRLSLTVGPDGSGGFYVEEGYPELTADLSLRSGAGAVDLQAIEGWVLGQVSARLLSSLEEMDLAGRLADGLALAKTAKGIAHVRGVYLTTTGRWYVDTRQ